jgi:NTP pyrophosphatase (non-canonical NTP hydrolase)
MTIEELIDRNYAAQVKRGQIPSEKIPYKFIEKLYEELSELDNEVYDIDDWILIPNEKAKKELIDIMLVCFSMAKHFGIDWKQVMTEKVEYNETRKD